MNDRHSCVTFNVSDSDLRVPTVMLLVEQVLDKRSSEGWELAGFLGPTAIFRRPYDSPCADDIIDAEFTDVTDLRGGPGDVVCSGLQSVDQQSAEAPEGDVGLPRRNPVAGGAVPLADAGESSGEGTPRGVNDLS